ncbi:MAG: protein kinase [Candidatus Eisenbacteria bacterium]
MIGKTISHYRVLEKLGEGGMGVVYKAEDTKLGRTVALKFLPPELTKDPEAKQRFVHEAQAASALDHPNICTIHEIDEVEGLTFISMACIEGESLKKKIQAGPLPIDEAIGVAIQVAEGLEEAHEKGIVHRDIKPDNVMVTPKGQAKIMDFGLARSSGKTTLTKEGTTLGTVAYMSPEQARGEAVDHRTDIWSLGVVLYEMITGRPPFKGDHEPAIVYSILNEDPEPPTALRTGVPMDLERTVRRCLEKDPGERYQTAGDLAAKLRHIARTMEEPATRIRKAVVTKRAPRLPWVAALLVVALLLAWIVPRYLLPTKDSGDTEKRKMLVVLPFENLGAAEDEYFADGISEEITSRLASIHGLGVISRTSATKYKDTEKTLRQIGDELNVDFALEGTIRWEKAGDVNRVRITPQLIRVSDDIHLWSSSYEQPLTGVFEVQAAIAGKVAEALNITLLEPERRSLESRPTENLDAYQAYLRGLDVAGSLDISKEKQLLEVQMFERAVALDSEFALAHAALSTAHSFAYFEGHDPSEERRSLAKAAADRALALDRELPEAHLALGYYHYYCHRNYDRALEEFAIAGKALPNDTRVLEATAFIRRRQGRWGEALGDLKASLALSPRDADIVEEIASTCMPLRRYEEVDHYCDRAIALAPDQYVPYLDKSENYLFWEGNLGKARAVMEAMPETGSEWASYSWYRQELLERDYAAALDRVRTGIPESYEDQFWLVPRSLLAGDVHGLMNEPVLARAAFDSARVLLEKEIVERPEDHRARASLGVAYAGLGRKLDAIREGKLAVELCPLSKDALVGPFRIEDLARIYTMVGEPETALDQIGQLLSIPAKFSVPMLRLDPRWDPLREHPRYRCLVEQYTGASS